jgi:adenosine deaminase
VDWLAQAVAEVPGVFVGMTTAGHEGMEIKSGGPEAMAEAYHRLRPLGLRGEGHYGEGAGVEHLDTALECLALDRLAHAVQMIESTAVIEKIRTRDIPVIMMPYINLSLGTTVHLKNGTPNSKYLAGTKTRDPEVVKTYLKTYEEHPFFTLLRTYHLPIALASDDPQQGGIDYKDQVKLLAGITYDFAPGFQPLSAEELVICNLNAVHAAFCEPAVKAALIGHITQWMHAQTITVAHPLLP